LIHEFRAALQVEWMPPDDLANAAQKMIEACSGEVCLSSEQRQQRLIGLVNTKFRFNRERVQALIDAAAGHRIWLNYHDKLQLNECFDHRDFIGFTRWRDHRWSDPNLDLLFNPISPEETLAELHEQFRAPIIRRSDARECSPEERRHDILRSLFGGYVYNSFPQPVAHKFFNEESREKYFSGFYDHLQYFHPTVLTRNCALLVLTVDESLVAGSDRYSLSDKVCTFIRDAYDRLSNHCFLAVLIKPFLQGTETGQWVLFSDIVLFAEKHRQLKLKTGYFAPERIKATTAAYIPGLDTEGCSFELANEGFFFRDCFILQPGNEGDAVSTSSVPVDLLVLLEKNERDESLIPCPACRSSQVRGNSYSPMGVKGWECMNPLCPERSAFDRGNRYYLSSIIKQQAINEEENQIPESMLRRWQLDIVPIEEPRAVSEMLMRHFSLVGDTVVFVNWCSPDLELLGRKVCLEAFDVCSTEVGMFRSFEESPFFKRFMVDKQQAQKGMSPHAERWEPRPGLELRQGDCWEVLRTEPSAKFDGAVTSPPYYNAREYSQWPNIYCYLYDIYNVGVEVYRCMKDGAVYLFNIFDYFDNENSIVLSTMGKKRMILGAYAINLFKRIGFTLLGNVAWYKGQIEGKRNFNQGNRSPYYQFPFNCWEHVLVLQKPGSSAIDVKFPTVLSTPPVVKMVRGENVHGHSAPFPKEIPNLLLSRLKPGSIVLDPYSGSMTTARAAHSRGIGSLSIELHREFCELGNRLLEEENLLPLGFDFSDSITLM
jgi:DNA modification methylase